MESPNPQYYDTVVLSNNISQPLEVEYSKNNLVWNIKHDKSLPQFYELLIKIELKWETALELNNFYNHSKMCVNAVTRLKEYLIP